MKLKAFERVVLMQVLPKQGGHFQMRAAKQASEKLEFTDEELKDMDYRRENGIEKFDEKKYTEKEYDIELMPSEMDVIKDELKKLESEKKLPIQLVDVYELFVGAPKGE